MFTCATYSGKMCFCARASMVHVGFFRQRRTFDRLGDRRRLGRPPRPGAWRREFRPMKVSQKRRRARSPIRGYEPGSPSLGPFLLSTLLVGRVPLLKQTTGKSRYPYSNLSAGGPRRAFSTFHRDPDPVQLIGGVDENIIPGFLRWCRISSIPSRGNVDPGSISTCHCYLDVRPC